MKKSARGSATPPGAKPQTKKRAKGVRGPLWAIIVVLSVAGSIRLFDGIGLAVASVSPPQDNPEAVSVGESCEAPPDTAELLKMFKERQDSLDAREEALADREADLRAAESVVTAKLADLENARAALEKTIAVSESAAENDLAKLTAVYESMKPKEAAPLFEAMEPDFAAGFLSRMRADSAAAIMARLKPETAYAVSVLLAGRNARAPTE
ncbi:MAG: hypothetical protein D6751_05705 [Deltaproteobacteria bacterium]|nr:MAG: hypothetical protein D6751_05705 [Deltaproteobacteria bacterium]